MATSGDLIPFRSSHLHYYHWGRGDKLLLCFHGYGESAASFAFLAEALGSEFTILAIDLPFHGRTDWKETLPFTVDQLISIIDTLLADAPPETPWYLMGYSMGGRVALSLLEKVPERIKKLVLLAPDGLRLNPWYWLATQTAPGRLLFKWTMSHPGWFFFILRAGNTLKLVNPSIYKFVANYIGNWQIRQDLYIRWTALRRFRPGMRAVKAIIHQRQLPIRILYGRFDRIIRVERGEQFRKGIATYCQLIVLPAGHQLLQINHLDVLVSLLKE
jgi:pimeloyl-ACP methyl ester carboxylesterase